MVTIVVDFVMLIVLGIWIYQKLKDEDLTVRKIISVMISPIIFPIGLFIYGFTFHQEIFIPSLIAWEPTGTFWMLLGVIILFSWIFNLVKLRIFPDSFLGNFQPMDIERIALRKNKFLYAVRETGDVSLSAGIIEELLYRFLYFIALQPVIFLVSSLIGTAYATFIPAWLTLGFSGLVAPAVLLSALLINLKFAYDHKKIGEQDNLWHRVISAWFLGWLFFLSVSHFGLLGAMAIHFLYDFVVFLPVFYLAYKTAERMYWKSISQN